MGDEKPPLIISTNDLAGLETKENIERNQCSANPSVSQFPLQDFEQLPSPIRTAAMWISTHEDDIRGPRIPFIRSKFDLDTIGAVTASRLAHKLRYAAGAECGSHPR
ncbi:hypothetical protein [Agrobacterium vitis]|uniref:hypothetical protein n=1 Tax=Agrobacterium vitis TaxID=373 RepID=UPI0018D32793|nr:hypothetical protein [Agrobacterium vitis]